MRSERLSSSFHVLGNAINNLDPCVNYRSNPNILQTPQLGARIEQQDQNFCEQEVFSYSYDTTSENRALLKRISVSHLFLHLLLGAGSYAGCAAIDAQRRWQVGTACAGGVALAKELTDLHDGKDTPGETFFHIVSILAGAGAVAGFYH